MQYLFSFYEVTCGLLPPICAHSVSLHGEHDELEGEKGEHDKESMKGTSRCVVPPLIVNTGSDTNCFILKLDINGYFVLYNLYYIG
jgi:hypothetical protein